MATSEQMMQSELLRLVTAGSVDDGKSTLLGRLLYDTKQILADQLEHIEETSLRRGDGYVNLALLTDGLRAEREQGITIDVAYRSFVTARRRFQLADAPGHVQYTRNMVTGASTADVAVILLDARNGVVEQTRRHAYIAAQLVDPARRRRGQQDGSRRLLGRALRRDRGRPARALRAAPAPRRPRDPDVGAPGRQRRRSRRVDALVHGPDAARASRGDRDRRRPQPRRQALPGAVGDPADVATSITTTAATPARSPAASGGPATRSSCCRRAGARGSRRSRPSTARSRPRSRRSRSRSASRTTSTSAAATCSPIRSGRRSSRASSPPSSAG